MDCDLAIVGAGPGGYVAAIKAGQLNMKVILIEKDPFLGGTCLNVGCIPSKALLQSSEQYEKALHQFALHGIHFKELGFNFDEMQKRKQSVIETFRAGIEGLMKKNRVEVVIGKAEFIDSNTLIVNQEKKITFKNAIVASGSSPMPLPFLPYDEKEVLSSTGALALKEVPKKLGIIGAGVIGVELGSVYHRLGSKVEIIEFLDKVVPTLDLDVSKGFQKILEKQGLIFHLSSKVIEGKVKGGQVLLTYEKEGTKYEESFDKVLVSIGRKPNSSNLGLEKIGVEIDQKGFIVVDDTYQTKIPSIYAIGDVIGQPMLAHKASDEGVAVVLALNGKASHVNMIAIPNVVYTDPEVACAGFTEKEVKDLNVPYKAFQFPMKANSRAKTALMEEGFIKVLMHEKGYLLGVHAVCSHAGELIQPLLVYLNEKIPLQSYEQVPHAHPTLVEAVKEAVMGVLFKPIHS
ncbi:MAG: dihydrolipoyl dehydrogenase [Chlamydiae bacterium]|nr:dihydrolipoyl dehydrogenase [Chlamydiota bacterium]